MDDKADFFTFRLGAEKINFGHFQSEATTPTAEETATHAAQACTHGKAVAHIREIDRNVCDSDVVHLLHFQIFKRRSLWGGGLDLDLDIGRRLLLFDNRRFLELCFLLNGVGRDGNNAGDKARSYMEEDADDDNIHQHRVQPPFFFKSGDHDLGLQGVGYLRG